jgi:hypothetical protein
VGGGFLEVANVVEANFQAIDSFVDITKISHIDILRLDVQGVEPRVMLGALEVFRRKGIRMICSEIFAQQRIRGKSDWIRRLLLFVIKALIFTLLIICRIRLKQGCGKLM